jgi:hypothetical protein
MFKEQFVRTDLYIRVPDEGMDFIYSVACDGLIIESRVVPPHMGPTRWLGRENRCLLQTLRHKRQTLRLWRLSYTIIRSPVTGIIGKRRVEVGQNVSVGQELMDVVSLDDIWITANFKETQLGHLTPGQPVEIKVNAYGRAWKGHVTNLGGATRSVLTVMPSNAAGNHGDGQRVRVRIDFDRPQSPDFNAAGLLKPGLSVEPAVRVRWLPRTPSPPDRLPGSRL